MAKHLPNSKIVIIGGHIGIGYANEILSAVNQIIIQPFPDKKEMISKLKTLFQAS
jgi:hypothetical protein